MFRSGATALAACVMLLGYAPAYAAAIAGQLWLNHSDVAMNATIDNALALGVPDATFTTDAIDFDSTIGGFTVGGFLNNPVFSDPSVAGRSLLDTVLLLTGSIALNAGDNRFVITHDDGVQLRILGLGLPGDLAVDEPGPTMPEDTAFNVFAPAPGHYDFVLSYGEAVAPPGQLVWRLNTVPEPASLALLGSALLGFGAAVGRRRDARCRRVLKPQ